MIERHIQAYLDHVTHRGLACSTVGMRRRSLTALHQHLESTGVRYIQQVQDAHLTDWVVWLKAQSGWAHGQERPRYAPSTIGLMILDARRFFRWLCARGSLLEDPSVHLTTAGLVVDRLPAGTIPTEQEMSDLFSRLPRETLIQVRNVAILELMYSSGLRTNEIAGLDVYDVDLEASTVLVRRGKGGKDRVVPVGRVANEALAVWLERIRPELAAGRSELACFVTRQGRRFSPDAASMMMRALRERHSPPFRRLHDLRHACAVHLLRGGADVRDIQELLGHAKAGTTAIYTRLVPTDLKEAHRRCHPRERHKDSGT